MSGNYRNILEGTTVFETTVTVDGFDMYGYSGFPYIVDGDRTITADLVLVDENLYGMVLSRLDRLEGYRADNHHHNHYDRRLITVQVGGVDVEAWIYVASAKMQDEVRETLPLIEGGDWLEHLVDYYADDYMTV